LTPYLVIFATNFILEYEYPYVNQIPRTTMPPFPCQAHITPCTTFSSNSKYMLHASAYPCHLNFHVHIHIHIYVQDVHVVIPITWSLLRERDQSCW